MSPVFSSILTRVLRGDLMEVALVALMSSCTKGEKFAPAPPIRFPLIFATSFASRLLVEIAYPGMRLHLVSIVFVRPEHPFLRRKERKLVHGMKLRPP